MSAACGSCAAPVIWIKTEATGKPMPLDAEPVEYGNVIIRNGKAAVLRNGELIPPGARRFTSHFATCPNSRSHRKREVTDGP